jgi:transcriptional regulator GlxA family with amidase domain
LRALTGQTPSEFLRHFRLQRAIELLLGTDRSVHDIALSCGFSSPQSFSRTFSREYGQPPDRWRRNRGPAGQPSN